MNQILSSVKTRLIVKAIVIGIVGLLMLFPLALISELVNDRQNESLQAAQDVGNSWSNAQTITGPVISVSQSTQMPMPYPPTSSATITETVWTHYLPDELCIDADLRHRELKRGIYPVMVYNSTLKIEGTFCLPATALQEQESFLQGKASVSFGISDLRGIEDQVNLTIGGQTLEMTSGMDPTVGTQGLTTFLPSCVWEQAEAKDGQVCVPFTLELPLKGSGSMWFAPMGKMNHIHVMADYPSPKFSGNYLPSERSVSADGFNAQWDIPYLTRNYAQQITQPDWYGTVAPSVFGVELLDTVSVYRQSQRAVKYALLVIVLTFVVVFFADRKAGDCLNVFQYLLCGLALVLFYSLLISLSEVLLFGWAYALSAVLTISLLTAYLHHLLPQRKTVIYISLLLCGIYVFIYILLQMESYALLTGSLGLFLILAGVMRLSMTQDK